MIISRLEFLQRLQIDQDTLEVWIKEEWLVATETGTDLAFSEADVARATLIRELMRDLGVNSEGVGVILNLLDQLHSMRKVLAHLMHAPRDPASPIDPASPRGEDPGSE